MLKASHGQGVVSSFVLESDDLDEVDWEWLGGDVENVQTNYFGKGDTTTYDRGEYNPIANPQEGFHTYAIDWTAESLVWSIDGAVVRTLNYGDAQGGARYPQTPMKVKMGNWVAGSSTAPKGTVQWAGGLTNFDDAPFTMYVKSVTITDGQTGAKSYSYGDHSGSWQSIVIDNGNGQQLNEETSSSDASSTAQPSSSSSSSSKAVSTSTVHSSSSVQSSTMVTVSTSVQSTTVPLSTSGPAATGDSTTGGSTNGSITSTAPSATSSVPSSADKFGANFAMVVVGAALTFFAL